MSQNTDPYSSSISDIVSDPDFVARWPLVKPRLANILIKGQLVFAGEDHTAEEIGQFSKFTLRILKLLETIDDSCGKPRPPVIKRPKLNPIPQ